MQNLKRKFVQCAEADIESKRFKFRKNMRVKKQLTQ